MWMIWTFRYAVASGPLVWALLLFAVPLHATEVIDQRGKRLELPVPAQRVVYIPPAVRSYLTVDDSSEHLAGSSAFSTRMIRNGLLGKIYPAAASVPDVTSNGWFAPNIEALLAVRPEAVFQTIQIGSEPYVPLERAGLNVVGITGVHGEEDFPAWARLAGAVAGKARRAEQLIERFLTQGERLAEALGRLPAAERPRVLYLMSVEPLRPMVGGSAFDQAISRAGGSNVAGELNQFTPVSFEQILVWNPQVILISGWPEEKHMPDDLFRSAQWSVLPAVKARRVYKVPLGGHRFAGLVEGPLFCQWLAELLHPQDIPPHFRSQFRETYRAVYRYVLSDSEIDAAIYMAANGKSAGYARFKAASMAVRSQ